MVYDIIFFETKIILSDRNYFLSKKHIEDRQYFVSLNHQNTPIIISTKS